MFTDGGDDNPDDPQPGTSRASSTKQTEFIAGEGSFNKFQRRFNLKSVSLHGESASADKAATG